VTQGEGRTKYGWLYGMREWRWVSYTNDVKAIWCEGACTVDNGVRMVDRHNARMEEKHNGRTEEIHGRTVWKGCVLLLYGGKLFSNLSSINL
jgi:hypothetical protein